MQQSMSRRTPAWGPLREGPFQWRNLMALLALTICPIGPSGADELPVLNPASGHYYQVVPHGSPNTWRWEPAAHDALSRSHMGMPGHLVTITSQAEQDFVASLIAPYRRGGSGTTTDVFHIGAYQAVGAGEPGGGWTWVTGEPFAYANWASGEPNNAYVNENRVEMWNLGPPYDPSLIARWNDALDPSIPVFGYGFIVEYEPAAAPDLGPCIISDLSVRSLCPYLATITWTTNVPALGEVDYYLPGDGSSLRTVVEPGAASTTHSVTLTDLPPGRRILVRARSFTPAGALPAAMTNSLQIEVQPPAPWGATAVGIWVGRPNGPGTAPRMTVTICNRSGSTMRKVRLLRGRLHSGSPHSPLTSLPIALPDIPLGGSSTAVLDFPAAVPGYVTVIASAGWKSSRGSGSRSVRHGLP